MKIRSITYFCNPQFPLDEKVLRQAGEFLSKAKSAYESAGYEVQTTRLATIPFPYLLSSNDSASAPFRVSRSGNGATKVATTHQLDELPKFANHLSKVIQEVGIAYVSLGPALPESPRSYELIPEAIAESQNIFFGGVMADESQIYMSAVKACADVIVKSAPIDPNGFANLNFAALANVKAGAPFFPAAYHNNDKPAFALAVESADLAVDAFSGRQTIDDGRRALIAEITKHGQALARISNSLIPDSKSLTFNGIDFSLAPFPDDAHSLGNAVENMGVPKIGLHGSLAAAAILTEAIERADFPHVGFNGFMQPVLEDSVLAKRAAEGTLTVKDALLYSAVCGTGLDTVPLPGDTTSGQIVPLLMDLCALALRLNKPLTARLMPVPGKRAGDSTSFDFGFFANSKVMTLDSGPLNLPMNDNSNFSLNEKLPR
jgi:uncharacterized protein (UPF0210 family)